MGWSGTLDYWLRGQLFALDKMVVRVANNKYVVALFPPKLLQLRGNLEKEGNNSPPVAKGVLACVVLTFFASISTV